MKKFTVPLFFFLIITLTKELFSSEKNPPLLAVAITPINQSPEQQNDIKEEQDEDKIRELTEEDRKKIVEWRTLVALCQKRGEIINFEPWKNLKEKKATERELQLILKAEHTWV